MAGRIAKYGKKKVREVSVTEEGWQGVLSVAHSVGCTSVSEFLEELGRNPGLNCRPEIDLPRIEQVIAAVLPTIPIKDRALANKTFKKLMAHLQEK